MPRSHHASPDLSLRHLPDISDTSNMPDFSEASFQIPLAGPSTNLLAEETMNFFGAADDSFNTPMRPAKPRNDPPLTLAELTPRARITRAAPVRSSLRPRPGIPTPHRPVVAMNLAAALSEDVLAPLRSQDASFQIPVAAMGTNDLLHDETSLSLGRADVTVMEAVPSPPAQMPLTLSQLSPIPVPKRSRWSPSPPPPNSEPAEPSIRAATPCLPTDAADISAEYINDQPGPSRAIVPEMDASPPPEPASQVASGAAARGADLPKAKGNSVDASSGAKGKARADQATRRQVLVQGDKVKRKPTVIGGGISKNTKRKLPRSNAGRTLPAVAKTSQGSSQRARVAAVVQHGLKPSMAGPSGDRTATKEARFATVRAAGGLAATLMSYGQRYMQEPERSEERDMSEDQAAVAASPAKAVLASAETPGPSSVNVSAEENRDTDRDRRLSLSLSQLSAQNAQTPALAPAQDIPVRPAVPAATRRSPSPTHPPIKRSTSAVPDPPAARHKRSRTGPTPSASVPNFSSGQPAAARALQPSRAKNAAAAPGASSRTRLRAATGDPHATDATHVPASRPRGRSGDKAAGVGVGVGVDGQLTDASSAPAASRSAGRSGDPRPQRSHRENVPEWHSADGHEQHAMYKHEKPVQAAVLHAAKPTKPIEFRFESDTRAEARKAELAKSAAANSTSSGSADAGGSLRGSRSKGHAPLSVPDFKALHAAHESQRAAAMSREHRAPTVPVAFAFSTDVRTRERERFEEARRGRELELEAQMEERRRLRELEEEQEVRELRRSAVPKAHEIPDWYADAPKKAGKTKT